jgi:hypothetical protein
MREAGIMVQEAGVLAWHVKGVDQLAYLMVCIYGNKSCL